MKACSDDGVEYDCCLPSRWQSVKTKEYTMIVATLPPYSVKSPKSISGSSSRSTNKETDIVRGRNFEDTPDMTNAHRAL